MPGVRHRAIAPSLQSSWGRWSRLSDLRAHHPAFIIRDTPQGLGLDTQRWDISGGEACWPTTRIVSMTLPWWRRLAERLAQRCLIPVTACTATLPSRHGRDGARGERPAWFTPPNEPVFTIAGLWRETGDARCFAMVGCLGEGPFSVMPVVIAPEDRETWLHGTWDDVAALQRPCAPEHMRIGLPESPPPFYARNDHDQLWALPMTTGR